MKGVFPDRGFLGTGTPVHKSQGEQPFFQVGVAWGKATQCQGSSLPKAMLSKLLPFPMNLPATRLVQ